MKALIASTLVVGILWLAGVTVIAVWPVVADAPWEDEGEASTAEAPIVSAEPTSSCEALSYQDRHEMCAEFARCPIIVQPGTYIESAKYQACMECGPDKVRSTATGKYFCG